MAWPRSAVCDQFICATGVSALALASQAKRKKNIGMPSSERHRKKRRLGKKWVPRWGPVERLASLGFIALWFNSLARHRGLYFFSCFSLGSSGTATDVFITIVSFSLSALALSVGEVHIRRDGITDYFPFFTSYTCARFARLLHYLVSLFFLSHFFLCWIANIDDAGSFFFSLASIVIPPGPTMPVLL